MIRVAAGLIRFGDLWLVAQRGPKMKMPGYWEFPGGKIEPGESPEAALVREIQEELELDVTPTFVLGEFPHRYDFGTVNLVAVMAIAQSRHFQLREHAEAKWLSLKQIGGLNLAPADVPILAKIIQDQIISVPE